MSKGEKISEENARKFNKSVPDDLILSLKQAEQPKEYLGPPSKRNLSSIKPTIPVIIFSDLMIKKRQYFKILSLFKECS